MCEVSNRALKLAIKLLRSSKFNHEMIVKIVREGTDIDPIELREKLDAISLLNECFSEAEHNSVK